MEVRMEFEARSYDVDFAGIVSNIVYHRWLEDLRLAVLAQRMSVPDMMAEGLVPTLAQTLIDFRAPLRHGERAVGRQAITSAGKSSFVFETEMRRVPDDRLVAAARHTAVVVDAATGRPVAVPAFIRELVCRPSFDVRLRGLQERLPATQTSVLGPQSSRAAERE